MLSEEEKRLRSIYEVIGTESFSQDSLADLEDIKWLIGLVLKLDEKVVDLQLELDRFKGEA